MVALKRLLPIGGIASPVIALVWLAYTQLPASAAAKLSALEPPAPLREFREQVLPVLERRCNGCHGVLRDEYERLELEPENQTLLRWVVDESGRVNAPEDQALAYERCTTARRVDSHILEPIDYSSPVLASPFVRAPLATRYSGAAGHPEVFGTPDDPDCRILHDWISAEIASRPATDQPFTEVERFFAEDVTPILMRKTCFGTNCHGKLAFNDLKLDPGIPVLTERFTPNLHRKNRGAMLGSVTRLVHLSGDVTQSKQLLKNIPVEEGGIVHKGGNNFLHKGDPDYQVLLRWLELEAVQARERTTDSLGDVEAVVFVRRPTGTPERFFEDTSFLPGGDLYVRDGAAERNLTAALHPDGPADVRAPDVSYDGKRVVFAMRLSQETPFNLWELELKTESARQLTYSPSRDIHYLDPLYVPDPSDTSNSQLNKMCVVLVSNAAGGTCESSPGHILGEAEEGTSEVIIDTQRRERASTFDGCTLRVVRGSNTGAVRQIDRYEPGRIEVDREFDAPCDSTTHYVIDTTARRAPRFDAYRLGLAPPGEERAFFDSRLVRMTYSRNQIRRPTMRSSGEIVFSALRAGWQNGRPYFNGALYRTHVDGSNFHPHNGNRSGVPIHCDDREMPNGLEIRIGRDADSWWGGALLLSDHQFGPTIENYNPSDDLDHPYRDGEPDHAEHRFVPGWISLDPDVEVGGVSQGGAYRDPYPMPDGSVLVAFAAGPIDLSDAAAAPNFDIVRLSPTPAFQLAGGFKPGEFQREVMAEGAHSELWPRPVYARLKESVTKSLKEERSLLGAPAVANGYLKYPAGTPAVLQVFDTLLLDTFFEQTAPVGHRHIASDICPSCGAETGAADTIRYVRIIGADTRAAEGGDTSSVFMITEVPVESDGSFYAAVPSGISFDLQSLNEDRMALRSPSRWLYCLPGEKHTLSIPRALYPQTCSGCHGGLSGRPEDTLRRPDSVSSASRTKAAWNDGQRRLPYNWSDAEAVQTARVDVNFAVREIVREKCAECHTGGKQGGNPNLSGEAALENLREYVATPESKAINSYLIEKLTGRELRSPRKIGGESPHPAADILSEDEVLAFVRWVDLGAGSWH